VTRAAKDLQADINRVTGVTPTLVTSAAAASGDVVLIGTIGRSPLIDGLVRERKLDVSAIAGKWESFILQTVLSPMPGVARAVIIAGSDKRGTIFGIYDLSEQIGVSPVVLVAGCGAGPEDRALHQAGPLSTGENRASGIAASFSTTKIPT
jgi:hypothetical protein